MNSAVSSSSLAAKGLDISLAALQRQDRYIYNIVDVASQVALYTYNNRTNEWEKTEVEGTLFIYTRLASPRHGFTIMNRLSMENLTEPITKDLDFQLQDPFLLYRNARLAIHGIWFYDKQDCQRIAQRMRILTQNEQRLAQHQGGPSSPGRAEKGGNKQAKPVDIIQMLTKARSEYDKGTSEPKEIGGSSPLSGNPNLIKPIPVKPSTQDSDGAEHGVRSLGALFGAQNPHLSKSDSEAASGSAGKLRPPVARTLTYDDTVNSGRNPTSSAGKVAPDGGMGPAGEDGRDVQCPAIAKLMQSPRVVAPGVGGWLHTVSESPENRLCDSGLQHGHHRPQQQHQTHHHLEQLQPDPIKRLLQNHPSAPLATSFTLAASPCCSDSPCQHQSRHVSSQSPRVESAPCSHHQAAQFFPPAKNQTDPAHSGQTLGTGHLQGVVCPEELLQKLSLIQKEFDVTSQDHLHPCPVLAPRFLGPGQNPSVEATPTQTSVSAEPKTDLQFQVISPQRIPATVAPTLLLTPSVFTQTRATSGAPALPPDSCRSSLQDDSPILSRSQLQATLLHLIRTDSSFVDSIYEAYVSRFPNGSSSKYC